MKVKKRYYVIYNGENRGVYYDSWDNVKDKAQGHANVRCRGFDTENDAKMALGEWEEKEGGGQRPDAGCEAVAYVDGSYNAVTKTYACGVVLFYKGEKQQLSERFSDTEMARMRNVAGEMEGAKMAMAYCVEHGIKSVEICYDYNGIEQWCTGGWRTNKVGTKAYKQYYDSIKDQLHVKFTKVLAHSGIKYNEEADRLAKAAAGNL